MPRVSFLRKFRQKQKERRFVCVGLDIDLGLVSPEIEAFLRERFRLPPFGAKGPLMFRFIQSIIDETRDIAACYKPNPAFFDAEGIEGVCALHELAGYLNNLDAGVPWILDAKRGDVGHTCAKYAKHAFEVLDADAVTVDPWGGMEDGIDAFLQYKDRGVFVWCRGSNKGSEEFQDFKVSAPHLFDGGMQPLYRYVAERVAGSVPYIEGNWNYNGNCGVVVGATAPEQIRKVREVVGNMPILIPGVGEQEGELEESARAAIYKARNGRKSLPAIFNASRSVLYASRGLDFTQAARAEVERLNERICTVLDEEGVKS